MLAVDDGFKPFRNVVYRACPKVPGIGKNARKFALGLFYEVIDRADDGGVQVPDQQFDH